MLVGERVGNNVAVGRVLYIKTGDVVLSRTPVFMYKTFSKVTELLCSCSLLPKEKKNI